MKFSQKAKSAIEQEEKSSKRKLNKENTVANCKNKLNTCQ